MDIIGNNNILNNLNIGAADLPLKFPTANAAWPFNMDYVQNWAYWDNAFTPEECDKIIAIGQQKIPEKGVAMNNDKIRDSQISWLYASDEMDWAYKRLTDIVQNLNSQYFKFDIFGFIEGMQFTRYDAPGGKYGFHKDKMLDGLIRKLSLVVQLSEPEDYKGGDLCLQIAEEPEAMSKQRGRLVLFPSYVLHEVTPVTDGTRYSLVSWITGPCFR
jgi:PKHD-type hydroxylase